MNIAKLEDYLQIDSSRYNRPSIEALNYYATRFMLTIPFENIDVQNGKPISINIDALFNKTDAQEILISKEKVFLYRHSAQTQQKGCGTNFMPHPSFEPLHFT